jgi:hypothetical protein
MPGSFLRVREISFPGPGPRLPCGLYRWEPDDRLSHAGFAVEFICPDFDPVREPGIRRFFVKPVLERWLGTGRRGGRFLEQCCKYGHWLLGQAGQLSPHDRASFRTHYAIFRNRHEGRATFKNTFRRLEDFVDFSEVGRPRLITPGLDAADVQLRAGRTLRDVAGRILRGAASTVVPGESPSDIRSSGHVIALYESILRTAVDSPQAQDELATANGVLANEAGDTQQPQLQSDDVERQIRMSFVGLGESTGTLPALLQQPETFEEFVKRLNRAVPDRTAEEFTQWLKNVRQRGYLDLIPNGRNLPKSERDEARRVGKTLFSAYLWNSYRLMARCYDATMALCCFDFANHSDVNPSESEQESFQQLNRSQPYLASLPAAFLERPQLRWVLRPLTRVWGGDDQDLTARAVVPQLLQMYGLLAGARREADRGLDPHTFVDTATAERVEASAIVPDESSDLPVLESLSCPSPGCRGNLGLLIIDPPTGSEFCVIEVACSECLFEGDFRIDPNRFSDRRPPRES